MTEIVSPVDASTPEMRLAAAGFVLPPAITTDNLFKPTARDRNFLFVSGHVSRDGAKFINTGIVGSEFDLAQAQEIIRGIVLSCLASIREEIGELSRVRRILKVIGYLVCVPGFKQHSAVMNAGSEVLIAAFGKRGEHARSAIGVATLPHGAAAEIEMVVAVDD